MKNKVFIFWMRVFADKFKFSLEVKQKKIERVFIKFRCCYRLSVCVYSYPVVPMDTAWRFRLVLIMTFAIIIFGDMLGYANVKGDKNSNQRNVDTTQKKKNPNQNQHQQNIEGMCRFAHSFIQWIFFITLILALFKFMENKFESD